MIDTHTTDPAATLQGAALSGTCRRTQQGAARGGTAQAGDGTARRRTGEEAGTAGTR